MDVILPLFPLQLVAFPGEPLNLHVFEPRYRQLVQECEAEGKTFGLPAFIGGKVMEIGTEMRLLSVEKYESGESDIKTQGARLFRIQQFYRQAPGKLYAGADVEWLEAGDDKGDVAMSVSILDMLENLFVLLKIDKELPEDPAEMRTFDLAHHVGFSLEQEYQILCIPDETARQEYMREHLERVLPMVREMENLRKRAQMNGHFKNILPPNF